MNMNMNVKSIYKMVLKEISIHQRDEQEYMLKIKNI